MTEMLNSTQISIENLVRPAWHEVYFPLPRKSQALIESLVGQGFLAGNPLQVRRLKGDKFEILDGVGRFDFATQARIPTVPCTILDVDEIAGRKICLERNLQIGPTNAEISLVHAIVLLDEFRRLGGKTISAKDLKKRFNRKDFTLKRAITCLNFGVNRALQFAPNRDELRELSLAAQVAELLRKEYWPPLNELFRFVTPIARWMRLYYRSSTVAWERKIGPREKSDLRNDDENFGDSENITFEETIFAILHFPQPENDGDARRVIDALDEATKENLRERLKWLSALLPVKPETSNPKPLSTSKRKSAKPEGDSASPQAPTFFDILGMQSDE